MGISRRVGKFYIDRYLLNTDFGLPRTGDDEWLDLVSGMQTDQPPYAILLNPRMRSLLEAVALAVDEDLHGRD